MSAEKLERLRKEFISASGKVEKINEEMDEIRTELRMTAAEKMVELGLFKMLEWRVDYSFWATRGSSVKFYCDEPTLAFIVEVDKLLPKQRRSVWDKIELGSFNLFIFDDSVSIHVDLEKWSDLPIFLSELKGYGVETVNIRDLERSHGFNKMRVVQQRNLVDRCAEIFTISLKSKNDDNKNGVD